LTTTAQITEDRLARWADKLKLSDATPLVLLAVGHNAHSGELAVCTLDEPEMSREAILILLARAIAVISKEPG
jgi:folylpolyglutamate synthase/dihydropteroate synthase